MAAPDIRPLLSAQQVLADKVASDQTAAQALSDKDAEIVQAQGERDTLAAARLKSQGDVTDALLSVQQAVQDYTAAVQAEAVEAIPPSPLPKGASSPAPSDQPPSEPMTRLARK